MKPKELTVRGLILGALIATVFTAANVYLGLKVGLTFVSSIPAAVISMAILSVVKDSLILENNIVQTVASAAGTLSALCSRIGTITVYNLCRTLNVRSDSELLLHPD
jgi:putative OPT family oligopeptide transporter